MKRLAFAPLFAVLASATIDGEAFALDNARLAAPPPPVDVPEPATALLLGGIATFSGLRRAFA